LPVYWARAPWSSGSNAVAAVTGSGLPDPVWLNGNSLDVLPCAQPEPWSSGSYFFFYLWDVTSNVVIQGTPAAVPITGVSPNNAAVWIVEAPLTSAGTGYTAGYSPALTFTAMGATDLSGGAHTLQTTSTDSVTLYYMINENTGTTDLGSSQSGNSVSITWNSFN
jgi:hypothetical protein